MADAVTRLTLSHFRNYPALQLDLEAATPFVVLTGPNGAGKTNVLEAVSLLAPGRGLRGSALKDLICQQGSSNQGASNQGAANPNHAFGSDPKPWAVAGQLIAKGEARKAGTGVEEATASRRLVRLDGQTESSTAALGQDWSILWLTPQMDRLFAEGPSARRRFLDRLTLALYPDHGRQVSAYEKAMRERNRILADQGAMADAAWLAALENRIATHGVAVAAARQEMITALMAVQSTALQEGVSLFIENSMMLDGDLETALFNGEAPSDIESDFAQRLAASRHQDRMAGRQALGPHKTDLVVTHLAKGIKADLCSTGEQKALLLSLILNQAQLIARLRGAPPILLLDEVAAHLDDARRSALFSYLESLNTQIWITGTEAEIFQSIGQKGQFFEVSEGQVVASR